MKKKDDPGYLIGIDVGGTSLRVTIATAGGEMLQTSKTPSSFTSAEDFSSRLITAIRGLLDSNPGRLLGIGIAIAGVIDREKGEVICSPNLRQLEHIPFKKRLEENFEVRVIFENDANAAAVGEHRHGAGQGVKNMIYTTVSTGIGGGLILADKLYTGASGGAGEVGHIVIEANGPTCGCGKRGCLETLAAGEAIRRDAIARLQEGSASLLHQMSNGSLDAIDTRLIHQAAQQGDQLSLDVLKRASHYLSLGLASLINIFDPELFVLGGGLINMPELFLEPAIQLAKERVMCPRDGGIRFETARLGDDAGLVGALALLQDELGLS